MLGAQGAHLVNFGQSHKDLPQVTEALELVIRDNAKTSSIGRGSSSFVLDSTKPEIT
jgi:hypothetical protein